MRCSTRLTTLAGLACCLVAGAVLAQTPKADTVFVNGHFYLPGGSWASSMAVGRGVILAVGDEAAVKDYEGPKTRAIDLHGATVLPGFHDMHIHPLSAGTGTLYQCQIRRGSPPEEIEATVKACAAKKKPGEWITGHGWDNDVFKGAVQDKTLLDRAAPNNPVMLSAETGHSNWVNSLALKIAGITRNTKNPLNGVIEHDEHGEPNGMLREQAAGLVSRHVPSYTAEQNIKGLEYAQHEILSYGITAIQDAGSNVTTMSNWDTLADTGKLKLRVRACMVWRFTIDGDPEFEALYAQRNWYRRDRLKTDCVKIFTDGVPGEGHTAAMVDPYANAVAGDKDESRLYGILMVPPDALNKMVTRFDKDGVAVMSHSTGDRSAQEMVNAVAVARRTNGFYGPLHQVGHSDFLQPSDIARASNLGIAFEYSAYLYHWNAVTRTYAKAIGPERFERFKPLRETIDAGAVTIEGSDWSVSPTPNPWIAIETLITRLPPGGGNEAPLAPKEKITLKEVIDVYTINGGQALGPRRCGGTAHGRPGRGHDRVGSRSVRHPGHGFAQREGAGHLYRRRGGLHRRDRGGPALSQNRAGARAGEPNLKHYGEAVQHEM